MDPLTLGLISAGLGAATGLGQYHAQQQTNRSNETIAKDATAANMLDAQRNRDFQASQTSAQQAYQTEMSNTAFQRGAADMKAAGINPIIAHAPASSPTGAAAGGAQGSAVTSQNQNPMTGINFQTMLSSGLQAMQAANTLDKTNAETNLIKTQTKVQEKDIPKSDAINRLYKFGDGLFKDSINYWLPKLKQQKQNSAPRPRLN